MITKDVLRSNLIYDTNTGIFTWIGYSGSRALGGSIAGFLHSKEGIKIKVSGNSYSARRLAFLWVTGKYPDRSTRLGNDDGNPSNVAWGNIKIVSCKNNYDRILFQKAVKHR